MHIGVMNDPARPIYPQVEAIGKAGFDFIDLTIEAPLALDVDVDRLQALLDRYELQLVGHTDPCLPYAYPNEGVRRACLQELERCARIFRRLGAGIMNIHPCYFCPPALRPKLVELNAEALPPIVAMAASHGLTLVYENFKAPFDRTDTFEALMKKVPGLALHLDIGHAHMGKDTPETFCRRLGHAIGHVHLSDNRASGDHHMPLGAGDIDWKSALQALKNTGYDGTITLEIFCREPRVHFSYLEISRKLLQDLWKDSTSPSA